MGEFHQVFFAECDEHLEDMEQTLLNTPIDEVTPDTINRLFRAAHSIKGGSGMFGFTAVTGLTHVMETLLDSARNGEIVMTTAIVDTLLLSLDELRFVIGKYQNGEAVEKSIVAENIAAIEVYLHTDTPNPDAISLFEPISESEDDDIPLFGPLDGAADDDMPLFAPIDTPESASTPEQPQPNLESSPKVAKKLNKKSQSTAQTSTIRVDTTKIDSVMNQLGELVITQSVLRNLANKTSGSLAVEFEEALDNLSFQLREMQESTLSIRMLPVSNLFSRFGRLVRDAASKANKQVALVVEGTETEIDKTMIEHLADPLTHIIRNGIDHGIESPEDRVYKGKEAQGTLLLKAFQQGSSVIIQLKDDGAGLNREKIIEKARQKGMAVSAAMPDESVWKLIFEPGFSTAEQVSDLSGRGVGMDVVKRNVEDLNGTIDIQSESEKGTTFTLILPLTLAILDGMSVKVGKQVFIIPLLSIVESFQVEAHLVKRVGNQPVVLHRDHYWPILSLAACMGIDSQERDLSDGIIVLLNASTARVALLVDDLVGEQQIVVKSLKKHFRTVPNVSAATILGDGSVSLILDVEQLTKQVSLPPEILKDDDEQSEHE
ncbi:chemotaxis protein CheA [Alteromonas sediminis]|uniref:Chemotaxis protein CheA n=1 Tax=Alteromonas sediminis TaxID=2259342 RepID=A0A3N5ZBR8_9ALTE|nr:chemotaxis protein CheA [Alteromonas sediminis]